MTCFPFKFFRSLLRHLHFPLFRGIFSHIFTHLPSLFWWPARPWNATKGTPSWGPYRGTNETSSYTTKKPHRLGGCNLSPKSFGRKIDMADEGIFRSFFGEGIGGKTKGPSRFFEKNTVFCFFFFLKGGASLIFLGRGWISLNHFHPRPRCFFPSCGIVESSDGSSLQKKTGKWCSPQNTPLCFFWSKDYDSAVSQTSKLMKQTNKSCWFVGSTGFLSIGLSAFSTSQKFNKECQYFWNTK